MAIEEIKKNFGLKPSGNISVQVEELHVTTNTHRDEEFSEFIHKKQQFDKHLSLSDK